MFSLGAFSGTIFAGADPEIERTPPASPTPVSFPQYGQHATSPKPWTRENPPPDLVDLYSHTTRHIDLKSLHLEVLNVHSDPEPCTVEELIPRGANDVDFYPRWEVEPAVEEEFIKVGPNGRPTRPVLTTEERLRKDFLERLSELQTDNDTAFRVLNKRNLPGVRPPRIATMRKFWAQLENLSHYWDTSLDEYFDVPIVEHTEEDAGVVSDADERIAEEEQSPSAKSPKRQRVDNGQDVMLSGTATSLNGGNGDSDDVVDTVMTDDDPAQRGDDSADVLTSTEEPQQQSTGSGRPRYKGRRIGTGRAMHERFRSDALLAFVEGCAWPFNSTVIPPRKTPVVRFANLNIPIKQLACVYRLPNDGARRRTGWIQGPVIGLQARAEVEFSGKDDNDVPKEEDSLASSNVEPAALRESNNVKSGSSVSLSTDEKMDVDVPDAESPENTTTDGFRKPAIPSLPNLKPRAIKKKPPPVVKPSDRARLDILREIGLLLEIAQERYREGKTENKPGEGKWWTEKPRFGGGKSGDSENTADNAASSSSDKNTASSFFVDRLPRPAQSTTKPSQVASRPATTASPTTLDFSSLRNKSGAGSATTTNGLGKPTPSLSNTNPSSASASTESSNSATPTTTNPIHPPMPTSTSKPCPPTIDPILAVAATPTAAFANEIFARYQRRERKSPAAMWEILRCPTATWDAKTEYRAIGKERSPSAEVSSAGAGGNGGGGGGGDGSRGFQPPAAAAAADDAPGRWDDVFLVSALNHHLSILRLTVHDAYLEYLLTGEMPPRSPKIETSQGEEGEAQEEGEDKGTRRHWSIPLLRRSEWFDLLDPKSRCEAFRALWGVMAYLNRGEEIW